MEQLKKNKEIEFGYICNSNDLNIDYQLNKNLYENLSKNFKSFHIINLIKIINNKNSKKKNIFPNNFKIFTPRSYNDLNFYLSKKNLFCFIALGREPKYLKLLYYLKKNNVKLMLNFNSGILPKVNIESVSGNIYFFYTKIYYIFFRFLNLVNIIPSIEIVFEVNNYVKKHFDKTLFKKIRNIFNLNLSYFKNIIRVNSKNYDDFYNLRVKLKEDYICFLDSGFNSGNNKLEGNPTKSQKENYYKLLELILLKISNIYNKKIIICAHPKSRINKLQKYLPKFKIIKYQTKDYILKSKIVIFHESSAINWAIILKKKIICLSNKNDMGPYYSHLINACSKMFAIKNYEMNDLINFKKKEIIKLANNSNKNLENFINNVLCINYKDFKKIINGNKKYIHKINNLPGYLQIINYLKKIKYS